MGKKGRRMRYEEAEYIGRDIETVVSKINSDVLLKLPKQTWGNENT